MKFGIIIPDRNDRPQFTANCLRMIEAQTIKPTIIEHVKDFPIDVNADGYVEPVQPGNKADITLRYRIGYERLRGKGLDVIFLIENDDWYSPDYFEVMLDAWKKHGYTDIFGTNYTKYYHLKLLSHFDMNHQTRSSAMSTMLKPNLDFAWCKDEDPFTDLHLWRTLKGVTFKPHKHICMGFKHGVGLCGGKFHTSKLYRYDQSGQKDSDMSFLKSTLDEKSFEFYKQMHEVL